MTIEQFLINQIKLVLNTQKNKRRGHDSLVYENHIVPLTVRGMYERLNKTLRIKRNYAFLVSLPRWREIMATEFEGRKIDHEICDIIIPLADRILSPYTFNNRVGKGSMAAINQLIENIFEVTCGYTKPARIIKIDFKSYFPNAMWNYAEKCLLDVLKQYDILDKDYLEWLIMISIHCNPAQHCELRSPKYLWDEHIPDEKSVFKKPVGVGAAIGRLIWQTAMGLYINDIIKWLTDECGIKVVCFVDDIVLVVPEHLHGYALSFIPILREKLFLRNVFINESKFYDQPVEHGVEFLGSHLKNNRIHLNNRTYNRAVAKIKQLNNASYMDLDAMVSSFNSYSGLLKNRTDYKRLLELRDTLKPEWWTFLDWDTRRKCLVYKFEYSINSRLNRKYGLNIKLKKRKNYDKFRETRAY